MRIKELITEKYLGPKGIQTPGLEDAITDWASMEETVKSVSAILASTEAQPFTKPPTGITGLYRAIVPKNQEVNSIKSKGSIVAYATNIAGAQEFIHTLGIKDRYVIIRKDFSPKDFVFDFTNFFETFDETSLGRHYSPEHEVWMKNTPYYSSASKDEIIYDSGKL